MKKSVKIRTEGSLIMKKLISFIAIFTFSIAYAGDNDIYITKVVQG